MKFVALVSGGKDSLYSIQESIRNGHELLCCIHLGAPVAVEEESFMYQTAGSNVLPVLVKECLGVPLILHTRTGKSVNTSLVYDNDEAEDEVEDLHVALKKAVEQFPDIQAVSSGAILSTYQRVRIEHVCSRLGLTSLSYLWRLAPQHELLKRMLDDGIEAVLVKTACPPGLVPSKHLNKTLGNLYYSGLFERLHERYRFHYCGEGGEYESLVVDCPLYKKTLVLDEVEIVETDDGVGELVIKKCHAEDKIDGPVQPLQTPKEQEMAIKNVAGKLQLSVSRPVRCLPKVRRLPGGLLHFSEIMSPVPASSEDGDKSEAQLAVMEALAIFEHLKVALQTHGGNSLDVLIVHLYLSEISHFGSINQHYRDVFGTLLPPSRSCVAIGRNVLPGGRRVMLDCMIQLGSGAYMRQKQDDGGYASGALTTRTSNLRQVLHVQSLSHWAPVCVGPYSQVNTLRSGLHFVAGQIGLDPPTMKLREGWANQLKQTWTNLARILDALEGGSLDDLLSCLIYVSSEVTDWNVVEQISQDMIASNGNVVPGAVESTASLSELYGGYEDEDTWLEMTRNDAKRTFQVPILIVSIPEMPVGALIEVETICVTSKAASCLDLKPSSGVSLIHAAVADQSEATQHDDASFVEAKEVVGSFQTKEVAGSMVPAKPTFVHQASDLSIPFDQVMDEENLAAAKRKLAHRASDVYEPFDQRVDTKKSPSFREPGILEHPAGVNETIEKGQEDERPEQSPLDSQHAATSEAKLKDVSSSETTNQPCSSSLFDWNTGYDFDVQSESRRSAVQVAVATLALGTGCAALSTAVASNTSGEHASYVEPEPVLSEMIDATISSLEESSLCLSQMLHVRLYYVATDESGIASDDGLQWRTYLSTALALKAGSEGNNSKVAGLPAISVVPVRGIKFVCDVDLVGTPFVAIQVLAIDPIHMETELWIHHAREEN